MSSFACEVVQVTIEPHPNADAIELARVGGYVSIVKKGQFKTGDWAVYIPEQALLPQWLLEELGFWDDMNGKGKLGGSAGNRVRAIKLRGVLSQGLLYPTQPYSETEVLVDSVPHEGNQGAGIVQKGGDAAECMGIVKWEPQVPAHMAGKIITTGDMEATLTYDFENIKKHPEMFQQDEMVVLTEKLHGTFIQVGLLPRRIWEGKKWADKAPAFGEYRAVVTSKGLAKRGELLDMTDATNLYVKTAKDYMLHDKLLGVIEDMGLNSDTPIFLMGEVFGGNVQDLSYGLTMPYFKAFDIYVGDRNRGDYLGFAEFNEECAIVGIPTVPVLTIARYSQEEIELHTSGWTTLKKGQIREGIVIKALDGSSHKRYGRKIAKSISEDYLMRKNATEFV